MLRRIALLGLLLAAATAVAQDRPRIGLVLSGGGARGIAHIGVLRVLEQWRVPIDAIAGTSMGAIVGGAYAAGVPVAEMERLIGELDWADLFRDSPPRERFSNRRKQDQRADLIASVGLRGGEILLPEGAVSGQKLDLFLRDLVAPAAEIDRFNRLPIPFRAIATDLVTGEPVVFSRGPLETALRASMSIPGLIAPLQARETLLVDGGLVRNLPVDVARQLGAEVVIAVNLGTPLLEREELQSALGVTVQMIAILTEQNVQRSLEQLGPRDVLIRPRLGDITAADFTRAAEAIVQGEAATREQAERLRALSLSPRAYARWQRRFDRIRAEEDAPPVIDSIRVVGTDTVDPARVEARMRLRPGQPLDGELLREDLQRIYGLGDFDRVNYQLVGEDGRRELVIDVHEKSWGPDYLRFGVRFDTDFRDGNRFQLRASYLRTWVDAVGGEWQTDLDFGAEWSLRTEYHRPLDVTGRWFLAPRLGYHEAEDNLFSGGRRVAEFDSTRIVAGIDAGLDLDALGEWRLGPFWQSLEGETVVGGGAETLSRRQFGLRARLFRDDLNDPVFPWRGAALQGELWWLHESDPAPGERDYGRFSLDWTRAFGGPVHRFHAGLQLGAGLGGEPPLPDQFTLGGHQRLSGLRTEQLRGRHLGFARLVYARRLGRLGGALGGPAYAGGSLEL
ncbi:MAG: patatin-like phospholipase family protein, partial [Candidatus Competibacterales bacterium]|nr:patatin-like phospholipase family protein [Candidatus Competibacterales bacterium]